MFNRITPLGVLLFGLFLSFGEVVSQAGVVTFLNDYEGFLAAAGDVQIIDFETLPDGSPSPGDRYITPNFNYTSQGVTFSVPAGHLLIGGNPMSGFELIADAYDEQQRTWIIADLDPLAAAVGVWFAGGLYLDAYDRNGELIANASFGHAGGPWFVGIVSDDAIFRAVADKHDTYSLILDFAYGQIPEPATILLLLLGSVVAARRRQRK